MNWRVRLPGALYRLALEKAGDDGALAELVTRWLDAYVRGQSEAQANGARGGKVAAERMTPEERRARGQKAVETRNRRRLAALRDSEGRPSFEWYRLPDGRVVPVYATASKGWTTIGFTLAGGEIVDAVKVDPPA